MEPKEKLCHEVKTVKEFTYLGDWVYAGVRRDCQNKIWVGEI